MFRHPNKLSLSPAIIGSHSHCTKTPPLMLQHTSTVRYGVESPAVLFPPSVDVHPTIPSTRRITSTCARVHQPLPLKPSARLWNPQTNILTSHNSRLTDPMQSSINPTALRYLKLRSENKQVKGRSWHLSISTQTHGDWPWQPSRGNPPLFASKGKSKEQ